MERVAQQHIDAHIQLADALPDARPPEEALLRQLGEYVRQQPMDVEQLPASIHALKELLTILEGKLNTLEGRVAGLVAPAVEDAFF